MPVSARKKRDVGTRVPRGIEDRVEIWDSPNANHRVLAALELHGPLTRAQIVREARIGWGHLSDVLTALRAWGCVRQEALGLWGVEP